MSDSEGREFGPLTRVVEFGDIFWVPCFQPPKERPKEAMNKGSGLHSESRTAPVRQKEHVPADIQTQQNVVSLTADHVDRSPAHSWNKERGSEFRVVGLKLRKVIEGLETVYASGRG